jgi:MAF protein
VDEAPKPGETGPDLAVRLSELKARTAAKEYPDAIIIGSDQVACCDGRTLGKPLSKERALEQLTLQSGRDVKFYTGIAVFDAARDICSLDCVTSTVRFKVLTTSQIEAYLNRDQPFACAGSFKFESLGIALLEHFEGTDPSALIGLPLIRLTTLLAAHGVDVLTPPA